uniref:Uncharacterized protein n=1 Tax=Lactuca sativa TaxID=4236 RepID=A0A9R1X7R8_LACSA|nr:hypothetical protein LSAT_V11C500294070 [Lactuca sativa]
MADGFSPPSYNPNFKLIPYIILHDLSLLCSFIISHPLYSSYFIYFAPYLIKLVSLVSPLFIVTVLLSLLLTTTTAFCPKLPELKLGILQIAIEELRSNLNNVSGDVEECNYEDLEVYKILFDCALSITFCTEEASIAENSVHGSVTNDVTTNDSALEKLCLEKIQVSRRNDDSEVVNLKEEKGLEKLFQELDRFEESKTLNQTSADFDKVVEELQKAELAPVKKFSSGSDVKSLARNSSDNNIFSQYSGRSSSWRSNSSSTVSSHGSMRDEKEWRRTLACKLFEERHSSRGGGEGMDSLWEAYENDSSKDRKETMNSAMNNKKMMLMKNSNGGIKSSDSEKAEEEEEEDDDDDDEDDDEDEPEMSNGPLCCLQALKLSTGKMNLGMRKPNLVKITRALKGFGWLHHVKKKHGKKSSGSFTD